MMNWITEEEYDAATAQELRAIRAEIRRAMREKRMTVNAVSKGSGIAYCAVRDFIHGSRVPSYKTMSRIRLYVKRYVPEKRR